MGTGSRWTKDTIMWKISKYPFDTNLKKSEIKDQIKKAFDVWEKHTGLKFQENPSGSAHIDIRFEKREHGTFSILCVQLTILKCFLLKLGDGDPFDGPGGTLAHAFFPQYGGTQCNHESTLFF